MARNKVQSQKGLSEAGFDRQYGSEEQCRAALAKWRWPDGFVCPRCGGRRHSLIKTRALYQCTACRRQNVAYCRHHLRGNQALAAQLVSRPLSSDPEQAGHLQPGARPAPRRHPDHGMDGQAQAQAGDDGARCHQAPHRPRRDG